ncbi:hypothetical protein [Sorangium sp. So ce854]|uniref:hypothetical protein n=1 Tax=Sorangium sp. So ce854 TaxID=3133322 RepID=UPI003F6175AF
MSSNLTCSAATSAGAGACRQWTARSASVNRGPNPSPARSVICRHRRLVLAVVSTMSSAARGQDQIMVNSPATGQ